jgi:phosphotriesterase-related protein
MDFVDDLDYHRDVAGLGAYSEFSSFGREYYSDVGNLSFGHDSRRIEMIGQLVREGFADRILLGHDVCMKMDLRAYGGNGYGHISTTVLDRMRVAGVDEGALYRMLVENPRRVLTIDFEESVLEEITRDFALVNPAGSPEGTAVSQPHSLPDYRDR